MKTKNYLPPLCPPIQFCKNVKRQFKIVCLFAIFLSNIFSLKSQNLRESRGSGHYTYIYKITNEQLKTFLTQKWFSQSDFDTALVTPVDSFLTDSGYKKKLVLGQYIYVRAVDAYLEYELVSKTSFDVCIFNNNHDLCLFVYKKDGGKGVKNAEVELSHKKIKFDSLTNTYSLRLSKRAGFLSVKCGDEIAFYKVNRDQKYYASGRSVKNKEKSFLFRHTRLPFLKFYYRLKNISSSSDIIKTSYKYNYNHPYTGYIAFNKPKYLPKDTVKVKAFFLKGKTKTLNSDVKVIFCKKNYYEKAKQITWLKPVSKGAYVFQFVLGDTLELNNFYTISFINRRNGDFIFSKDFYLEDYQLNETSYEFKSEKTEYNRGEPVVFCASGKDANDLSLPDARVEIKARVSSIDKFISDSVFVFNTLWTHQQKLDPVGETKIIFPDSLLPNVAMHLKIDVTFNNSNNETHDTTIAINYKCAPEYFYFRTEENYLLVDHMVNAKPVSSSGILTIRKQDNSEEKEEIKFPFKELIDNSTKNYSFKTGKLQEDFDLTKEDAMVSCRVFRSTDSVFVSIANPRKLPLEYSIFKNGKEEVERGSDFELHFKAKDKSQTPGFYRCK